MRKTLISISTALLIALAAAGCSSPQPGDVPPAESTPEAAPPADTSDTGTADTSSVDRTNATLEEMMENTIAATITMDDGRVITLDLYPDLAPQSVRNFVSLARSGYYDGLTFHRIIKGFMIQGGCPDGTGTGNPGYSIKGEFAQNGFKNDLSHTPGVLSMARSNDFDSAGSQFFIVHGDASFLDGGYAAFGKVTSGLDVVDALTDTPVTDGNGTVASGNQPVISTITIDSDITLPEPDKLN